MFEKYFFAIGIADRCKELKESCDFCIGLDNVPKEMQEFNPKLTPAHPRSHMNADVMKRAGQNILVNTDMFSGYTTACMLDSEDRVAGLHKLILCLQDYYMRQMCLQPVFIKNHYSYYLLTS